MKPINIEAYKLLHEGSLALAKCEQRGIRVDIGYCYAIGKKIKEVIKETKYDIINSKAGRIWKKKYGDKMNINSDEQLSFILCKVLGHKPSKYTASGKPSMDKESLASINIPIARTIIKLRKLDKVLNTYLKNIIHEQVDGFIHPNFMLNTVLSYRSSCSSPNFQNMPIRDPLMGKIIRRAIIPRKGRRLAELDYKGLEVSIATCYHKDPNMIHYLEEKKDLHSDMACECFLLPKNEKTKLIRYIAKNRFVFPEFYGSYFKQVAPSLWKGIHEMNLITASNVPLKEYLAAKGINNYSLFEEHIEKVEYKFWNNKFPVYAKWKEDWYKNYTKKLYFDTLTHFRCQGYMKRNEAINIPVQGSAFHCLLKSLIKIVKTIDKLKIKSFPIAQIHDSIVNDVDQYEFEDYINMCIQITTKWLSKQWKWIIVPLDVEVEAAEINESWYYKKEIEELK